MVGRVPPFRGRAPERAALDGMLDRVREGEAGVLVIRGEPGIGKTALLSYCARQAAGCRVAQISGVESELEMPFAALHQLCEPMLTGIDALPEPQRDALRIAFGLTLGTAPDLFVVGLAVLGLLAEAAADRPLVCLVDDAQWLDEPSRQVLGFVGRRLLAEAVVLLLGVRESADEQVFPALPTLTLEGLADEDARALLVAAVAGQIDDQVRDRIVAETGGNPLRLLEVPRGMSAAELAGGFGAPHFGTSEQLQEHYTGRIRALPKAAQQLMLLAAADPTADATLVWRAAQRMGISRNAADAAETDQLFEIGSRTRFWHPLVRSAAYVSAAADERRAAHAALAEATDREASPERRVWHLAAAAEGPNEAVASELERAAAVAEARAGLAAGAAFLQRAVDLTADPQKRADRALAAAQAHLHAGAFDVARALLAEARAVAVDDVQRGRAEWIWGQIHYRASPVPDAPRRLLEAAKILEPLDVQLASETYLDAWMTSFAVGPRALAGGLLTDVSAAILSAPSAGDGAAPCHLFLEGFALVATERRAVAAPSLRRAVDAFLADELPDHDILQWGHLATSGACLLWDWKSWDALSAKHVAVARLSGALAPLSIALAGRAVYATWCGDFEGATALTAEYDAVNDATGIGWYSAGGLLHAAYQGRPEALALLAASGADSLERGVGQGSQFANWASAIVCLGLGRYADALAFAQLAAYEMKVPNGTGWALPDVVEAAVRTHQPDVARAAVDQLPEHMLDDSDWSCGVEARSRALVAEGEEAERWYAEAVECLARTPFRTELGRAHLLYGEWLRREGRRVDARDQLVSAYELFSAIGAEGFGDRARRELLATGEKVRKRDVSTGNDLTPQEEHIARLARDGHSNAEIGAELFLSVRTVEWHLRKVFQKLGIASRRELKSAMPARAPIPR